MKSWKIATVFALVIAAGALYSYQLSPKAKPQGFAASASEPGATPEEKLWEVLVLMGCGEQQPSNWDGRAAVASGELLAIEGYRFVLPDRLTPEGGWRMSTQALLVMPESSLAAKRNDQRRMVPKGVFLRGAGDSGTRVSLDIGGRRFSFSPMELIPGNVTPFLEGKVEVMRSLPATDLSGTELRQHDFPALAAGRDGTLWVAWASYHDRRQELNLRLRRNGRWSRLVPVARASEDLWRPQLAVDSTGKPWLIWAQAVKGNWDIYAMPRDTDDVWGQSQRLSDNALPDIEPSVTTAPDGTIYVVWQSFHGRHSSIRLRYLRGGKWSPVIAVSDGAANDWEPAVAAGPDNRAWITWDRYNASYDVYARSYSPGSGLSPEMKVAGSDRFEARSSVAVDSRNRPWVAWETGGVDWGKDLGKALGDDKPQGSPLGDRRRIEVVVLDNDGWKSAPPLTSAGALAEGSAGEGSPLLYCDPAGDVWLAFRRCYSFRVFDRSVYWESYLTRLEGERWAAPVLLPRSWARPSARLSLGALDGRIWAFWTNENREFAFAGRPLSMRVMAGSVPLPRKAPEPKLVKYLPPPVTGPRVATGNERGDVAAVRSHTIQLRGQTFRVLRGELHRHTEFSQDFGGLGDGTLPEFYRYVIDAADLDFAASTDHQAGGVDYWNQIGLESADMYHFPSRFVALYGYERNMPRPHGHRNIIHTKRDYPIVPFFQRISPEFVLPDTPDGELLTQNSADYGGSNADDTRLLYEELRKSGGLAIPHTTAGQNEWGDNDPKLDPVLEIYQGARTSAEHQGAPRGQTKATLGYAWDAWKKGYRIGVISSSDHYSTHISYAMVYTKANSRQAVFDAIRERRTYGATDNILLEFWLGDHFMGEDFSAEANQPIRVKVRGTGVVEKLQLIRDGNYIYQSSPGKQVAELNYRDLEAGPGEHWYYVRVEQRNGELAWSSPIWVRYR
jgi:hypothetical protein